MLPVPPLRAQSAASVAEVSVIVLEPGNKIVPKLHVKLPLVMVQAAASAPPTVQLRPLSGNASVSITFCAAVGPLFVTTTVKTASVPALMVVTASGVFTTWMSGETG